MTNHTQGGPYDPLGTRMNAVKHVLNCNNKPIEVVALADLHIGDANVDMRLIRKQIDAIASNPNRYFVLVGDIMNCAIMGSKSDTYNETMTPMDALQTAVDLLTPIADKCLAIVPGNHEERISRSAGVDMTRLLAIQLGKEDVFSETTQLVFLQFGKNWRCQPIGYSMYISHGTGGGRKPGGKLNALAELAQVIDTDIYVCGHTHLPATFKQKAYRICPQRNCAVEHEQLFVNTASAVAYGGYGRRDGYKPSSNSYPVITLDNSEHHMTCTV